MKKSLFLLSAFAMLLVASCQPEELGNVPNPNDPVEMTVSKTAFSVDNGEGTVTVPVDANYPSIKVAIAGDASSWLSYKETKAETKAEMKTYKVVLAYKANPIATARSGQATITLAAKSFTVAINQEAAIPTMKISVSSRTVNPRGMSFPLKVTTNDEYTATPSVDWASFDKEKGEVTVKLNGTGAAREGSIVFACKADPNVKETLTFTQKAANVDPELINVLAIGDSRTDSTNVYIYKVLQSLGYTKIRLVNVPCDGLTLAEIEAAATGTEKVTAHATLDGKNFIAVDTLAVDALTPDDWDAIVLQPSFEHAGDYDASAINGLVKFIRKYCEYTPLFWNMGWAYKTGATAAGFKNYGSDQMAMYTAIAEVATTISANPEFEAVIPVGTLIQNIRTSYVEENVLVDESNLSVNIGRLAAAYMMTQYITGKDPLKASTPFIPSLKYEDDCIPAMQEAYANAVKTPYAVTAATQYPPYVLNVAEADAKALIEAAGKKFEDYVAVPLIVQHWGFYNSSNGNYLTSSVFKGNYDSTTRKFAATHIIPKAEIPIGTLIVVLSGYQYRPEGWVTLTTKNDGQSGHPSRPGNVSTSVVEVNDAWWGTFTYRAFNISKTDGNAFNASEMKAVGTKFGVFIPKTAASGGLEDYNNGTWNW